MDALRLWLRAANESDRLWRDGGFEKRNAQLPAIILVFEAQGENGFCRVTILHAHLAQVPIGNGQRDASGFEVTGQGQMFLACLTFIAAPLKV